MWHCIPSDMNTELRKDSLHLALGWAPTPEHLPPGIFALYTHEKKFMDMDFSSLFIKYDLFRAASEICDHQTSTLNVRREISVENLNDHENITTSKYH